MTDQNLEERNETRNKGASLRELLIPGGLTKRTMSQADSDNPCDPVPYVAMTNTLAQLSMYVGAGWGIYKIFDLIKNIN